MAVIYLPSLPYITGSLHTTEAAVVSSLTIFYVCFGLAQLVAGTISDHWGRRPLVLMGFVIYIAGALVCVFTEAMWLFLVARILDGFGAGAMTSTSRATINDTHQSKGLVRGLALSAVAGSLVSMIAPTFGGLIQMGVGWRGNFVFLALYGLVMGVVVYFMMKETLVRKKRERTILHQMVVNYRKVLTHRTCMGYGLAGGMSFGTMIIYYTTSPFLLQSVLGITPVEYGLLFLVTSLGFIVGSLVLSRLPFHPRVMMALGLIILWIAPIAMLIFYWAGIFNVWSIVLPATGVTMAVGVVYPTGMGHAVRRLAEVAGSAAAMVGFIQMSTAAITSLIVAHLPKTTPIPMGIFMVIVAFCSSAIFYTLVARTPRPTTPW